MPITPFAPHSAYVMEDQMAQTLFLEPPPATRREAGSPILLMAALFLSLAPLAAFMLLDGELADPGTCFAPSSCRTAPHTLTTTGSRSAFAIGFAGSMDRR